MSLGLPVRLVDSFTAPKDILHEFADLAEEENGNPFILQKVFMYKNVSKLASEVGRLIFMAPIDILEEFDRSCKGTK